MLKWLKRLFLGDTQERLVDPPMTNLELFRAHRQWVKDNAKARLGTADVAYLVLCQRVGEDVLANIGEDVFAK